MVEELLNEKTVRGQRRYTREIIVPKFGERQVNMTDSLKLDAVITCPRCGHVSREQMPPDT